MEPPSSFVAVIVIWGVVIVIISLLASVAIAHGVPGIVAVWIAACVFYTLLAVATRYGRLLGMRIASLTRREAGIILILLGVAAPLIAFVFAEPPKSTFDMARQTSPERTGVQVTSRQIERAQHVIIDQVRQYELRVVDEKCPSTRFEKSSEALKSLMRASGIECDPAVTVPFRYVFVFGVVSLAVGLGLVFGPSRP